MGEVKTNKQDAQDAIKVLLKHMNIMAPGYDLGVLMSAMLEGEHRTIAQSFMKEINSFLVRYSEVGYDQRNENSVKFAKDVKALDAYFPMI